VTIGGQQGVDCVTQLSVKLQAVVDHQNGVELLLLHIHLAAMQGVHSMCD
jgi:hypothetical protein